MLKEKLKPSALCTETDVYSLALFIAFYTDSLSMFLSCCKIFRPANLSLLYLTSCNIIRAHFMLVQYYKTCYEHQNFIYLMSTLIKNVHAL